MFRAQPGEPCIGLQPVGSHLIGITYVGMHNGDHPLQGIGECMERARVEGPLVSTVESDRTAMLRTASLDFSMLDIISGISTVPENMAP